MQLISQLKPFGFARNAVSKLRVLALMFAWVLIGAGAASAQTLVDFSKSFSPSIVASGDTTTLSYLMLNNAGGSKESIAFTETLPAGLVIATPSTASTNCAAGTSPNTTLTATSGTSVITLDAIGIMGMASPETCFSLSAISARYLSMSLRPSVEHLPQPQAPCSLMARQSALQLRS